MKICKKEEDFKCLGKSLNSVPSANLIRDVNRSKLRYAARDVRADLGIEMLNFVTFTAAERKPDPASAFPFLATTKIEVHSNSHNNHIGFATLYPRQLNPVRKEA